MREHSGGAFDRYLGRLDVWALSLGCIIGWGAFVMPGTTFLPLAGPGGTAIAMLISTLVTLVIGYNYFALMQRYPGTGGVYSYSKARFGRDHAFLSAWFLCLAYVSLIPQNAMVLALICRTLTGHALQGSIHWQVAGAQVYLTEVLIVVAVLILIGFFAICMKPFLQWVQTMLGIILTAGILLTVILVSPHVHMEDIFSAFGTMSQSPLRGILSIVILAPWAFVGFEVVSLETAHFSFPVKRAGSLILLAILLGGGIYSTMAIVAIICQPAGCSSWQDYVMNLDRWDGIASVPVLFVLRTTLGRPGIWIITITAVAAVVSSSIGFYRASARMLMNMAQDHILSRVFNKPSVCFIFLMGISSTVSFFGRNAISWAVNLSSFCAVVGFGYASAAAWRAAREDGTDLQRLAGFAGVLLTVAFALAQLVPGISLIETMSEESYLLLAIWCLIGFAFYWRTMRVKIGEAGEAGEEQRNESVTIAALSLLLIISVVIWYIKSMSDLGLPGAALDEAVIYSIVLLIFILLTLIVMLLIHAQLKRDRMELEMDRIRAVENSLAKSRFLFNMSHDIRTPMNAIVGYAGLALKEPVSPQVRNYLEKIDLSSQHLLALINDILEMSRIESGRLNLEEVPTDLAVLFEELDHLFAEQMKGKGIRFSVDAGGIIHSRVLCDRKNLARALLNLISNAYKFTPAGGSIDVFAMEAAGEEPGRAAYEIHVRDSGIGMSEAFAEKMFIAFERERTSTDSGVEGTGLGLAITKSIVDLMDGQIRVRTAPGQGTEMILSLNLALINEEEQPVGTSNQTTELSDQPAGASNQTTELSGQPAGRSDQSGGTPDQPAGVSNQTTELSGQPAGRSDQSGGTPEQPAGASNQTTELSDQPAGVEDADNGVVDPDHVGAVKRTDGKDVTVDPDHVGAVKRTDGKDVTVDPDRISAVKRTDDSKGSGESDRTDVTGRADDKRETGETGVADKTDGIEEHIGAENCASATSTEKTGSADTIDRASKRLLLVEDNAINMEIASMILGQAGFPLETAENGQIAVDMITRAMPDYYDAVLMDIQMPVMDGYTATRTIRSLEDPIRSRIPIIAMTANAFQEDAEEAFKAGMQAHIAKPIDTEILLQTLDRILGVQK